MNKQIKRITKKKREELEEICKPIITKLYQGAGGAPGGGGPGGFDPSQFGGGGEGGDDGSEASSQAKKGPKIEEVD